MDNLCQETWILAYPIAVLLNQGKTLPRLAANFYHAPLRRALPSPPE
jgi:hypothetical protein